MALPDTEVKQSGRRTWRRRPSLDANFEFKGIDEMKDLPEFVAIAIKGVAWMLPMFILAIRSLMDLRSSSGPDHEASSYLIPVVLVAAILPVIAGIFHRSRAVALVAFGVWAMLAILCYSLTPAAAPPTEL